MVHDQLVGKIIDLIEKLVLQLEFTYC